MEKAEKKSPWKTFFSKRFAGSYEAELKTTLLLILLFLVLINFSSLRVAGKLSDIYHQENYEQLEYAASRLIDFVYENVGLYSTTKKFRDLKAGSVVSKADFIRWGKYNYAEADSGTYPINSLTPGQEADLEAGKPIQSGFGQGEDDGKIVLLYPFKDKQNQQWLGIFHKNASGLKLVQTVMSFNYLFQIAGILAILLVAYAYLKITLNPFRKMADEARKIGAASDPGEKSVEEIVDTFKATIARLQEKEGKLKELYNNSQERAARLEQFNQYILESMLSGLIGVDIHGNIIHLNQSACNLLELEISSVDPTSYKKTLSDFDFLREILDKVISERSSVERLEHRIVLKSGAEKILGVSGSPVHDHNDRLVGAILLINNLTEVRRLQMEIAFKEKMAAIGEMSAGLAHEMRNAMMAIVGYSKLLKRISSENSQEREIAFSISAESENCETMLKRFLMFAKPAAFNPEQLSLKEVCDTVVQNVIATNLSDQIKIVTHIDPDLPVFVGDKTALTQILTNLLKNSLEAINHKGQIDLTITHDYEKNLALISVEDNGPGVSAEDLPNIFSPFFTTKEQGTGLGLAIVKKLINSMGGKIEVESVATQGCKFTLSLNPDYLASTEFICKTDRAVT